MKNNTADIIQAILFVAVLVLAMLISYAMFVMPIKETIVRIYEIDNKLDSITIRLDKIDSATDTIYVDVDDMSQADWRSYTPTDKD